VSTVLIVDDEKILADSICTYLERHGFATASAGSGERGVELAGELSPDVVVMDVRLPRMTGLEALKRIRETLPGTEVVVMTAHASVARAVEAMQQGAFDYLAKPVDLDVLRVVIDKAVTHLRITRELSYRRAQDEARSQVSSILGDSPAMQALRQQIEQIAAVDSVGGAPSVLLRGETGTGKGLVASALHYQSARADGPFVEINCAAIPQALLEAELFGHERGAYTDAKTAKVGLFEAADGGTLFLDEIGHMDLGLQVKLLKVIEDKAIRRIGGLRNKNVNVRIITATNRDLEAAIAAGAFRRDLYFRIKVLTIELPPLRQRGDDIHVLADHFLGAFARQYGRPPKQLSRDAVQALRAYAWPGNVRELAHVMERVALLHTGSVIEPPALGLAPTAPSAVTIEPGGRVRVDFSSGGIVLDAIERELILEALQAAGGNRTRAAELLGISRDTLRYRLEKYALSVNP